MEASCFLHERHEWTILRRSLSFNEDLNILQNPEMWGHLPMDCKGGAASERGVYVTGNGA